MRAPDVAPAFEPIGRPRFHTNLLPPAAMKVFELSENAHGTLSHMDLLFDRLLGHCEFRDALICDLPAWPIVRRPGRVAAPNKALLIMIAILVWSQVFRIASQVFEGAIAQDVGTHQFNECGIGAAALTRGCDLFECRRVNTKAIMLQAPAATTLHKNFHFRCRRRKLQLQLGILAEFQRVPIFPTGLDHAATHPRS